MEGEKCRLLQSLLKADAQRKSIYEVGEERRKTSRRRMRSLIDHSRQAQSWSHFPQRRGASGVISIRAHQGERPRTKEKKFNVRRKENDTTGESWLNRRPKNSHSMRGVIKVKDPNT